MDAELAIASKRDRRAYAREEIAEPLERRILDAGRVAGSGMNRQARRFVVLRRSRAEAAELVTRPENVRDATLAIAIVTSAGGSHARFDVGRAAQNMMLAAWNEGVISCPNAIAKPDELGRLLGIDDGEEVAIVISFGFPPRASDPGRLSVEDWVAKADRRPFDEAVEEV
jgi:nitroreductase